MIRLRALWICLLVAVVIWTVFTWPLPRHALTGVPTSSRNIELENVRSMMPSDQLQLLYHYRLARDMIAGNTPWFYNLYEFNTGDDGDRMWPTAYFFPFSFIFSLTSVVGGDAFGINVTGLISLWLTLYLTWLLVRRYSDEPWLAAAASLLAIALPYRWASQLGGSPGGYAMVYVPMCFLGLDIAVRDRSWKGGVLAGVGILLACWGDVQVFFFCGLALPAWCVIAGARAADSRPFSRESLRTWSIALSPVLLFIAIAFSYRRALSPFLAESTLSGGRSLEEVALFAPHVDGLWSWENLGVGNHIYLGFVAPALLILSAAALLTRSARRRCAVRDGVPFALIVLVILAVVFLALGPNGPLDGIFLRAARKLIPSYDMIRQPARVYCLLPTLLAVAAALGIGFFGPRLRRIGVIAALIVVMEFALQVRTTVCILDPEQGAYAAVSTDAGTNGVLPRAIVVPLWPGDSDLGSLYQYYASQYRIRLINGYSPVISNDYFENVFRRFESINQGILADDQIDDLLGRGIRYALVHENAFPEKVSPFPVGETLARLIDHPRVRTLRRDEAVWAFELLAEGREAARSSGPFSTYFPTRFWEFERSEGIGARGDEEASGGWFVALSADGDRVGTRPARTGGAPRLRWEVRLRGEGALRVEKRVAGRTVEVDEIKVADPQWNWRSVFMGDLQGFEPVEIELRRASGRVDVDVAYLTAGRWEVPEPGRDYRIPAAAFFHAGYSDPDTGEVVFRADHEPDGAILYGPNLPLTPGVYILEFVFASDVQPGVRLGRVDAGSLGRPVPQFDVITGKPAAGEIEVLSNLPYRIDFLYSRAADMRVKEMVVTRLR